MKQHAKNIGLLGGTFDPVHLGHLAAAGSVQTAFSLDEVVFIPANIPPHKPGRKTAGARHRLDMIRLAIAGHPRMSVSDIEIRRTGKSFTIDTIAEIQHKRKGSPVPAFILGADAFFEIDTWKSYRLLFQQVRFIVVFRETAGADPKWEKEVKDRLCSRVDHRYAYEPDRRRFGHPENPPVHLHPMAPVSVSSTLIREKCRKGENIRPFVPETVAQYISNQGLYQ